MSRLLLLLLVVCVNFFSTLQLRIKIDKLSKPRSDVVSLGMLRGDFEQYRKNNLKVWNAQYRFNETVITELRKLHVLRSQNFTIESKDD